MANLELTLPEPAVSISVALSVGVRSGESLAEEPL